MEQSLRALRRDPRFKLLIKQHGVPDLKRGNRPFQALVHSIIYQQVSGSAARTIYLRFVKLFSGKFPTPQEVLQMSVPRLRSAGLSRQKISYIKDLAKKFTDGSIKSRSLSRMTNSEIIEHLTKVKGIGVWTVHMFLIFTLNRIDVLPTGDLAIRKGFQMLYGLKQLPSHDDMERIANPWRPHASIASWYLWRLADTAKPTKKKLS